jgi:putative ABC transport system permease protein
VTRYITLNYLDLALASVLVLINAGLSIIFGLKIHRSLLIAAIRMTIQLTLIGLVLTALFSLVSPLWTGLAVLAMIFVCRSGSDRTGGSPVGGPSGWAQAA